ncbi:MAG: hypothetical protein ACFFDP_09990 [Promethearchaeota archaeon]
MRKRIRRHLIFSASIAEFALSIVKLVLGGITILAIVEMFVGLYILVI